MMHLKNMVTIGLGDTSVGITSQDEGFMKKIRSNYRHFIISRQPEFHIEITLNDRLSTGEIRKRLLIARPNHEGYRYFTTPELINCRIDWGNRTLQINTEKGLFSPGVDYKLMNQVLRGVHSGIYKKLRQTPIDTYLVHGCGIVSGCKSYLFTGVSGSGKTTVARLANGRKVLNDEAVIIYKNGLGIRIDGSPLDGDLQDRNREGGHLSAIFFLEHAKEVTMQRLKASDAYVRFLLQVFHTAPLFEKPDNRSLSERADLSAKVVNSVPAYQLGFCPDQSFWKVVESV